MNTIPLIIKNYFDPYYLSKSINHTAELNNYSDTLCELYASTKIIPLQYRRIRCFYERGFR